MRLEASPGRHEPALVLLTLVGALLGLALTVSALHTFGFGVDSLAYWKSGRHGHDLYRLAPTERGAFLYSPAFAQAIWPLAQLPWPVFATIWSALVAAALLWLVWPLAWPWRLGLLALFAPELVVGNLWAFYAVVLVIGFRRPQAWALPLLTKITAGVGVIWFASRREWRQLALALAAGIGVAAISFASEPALWRAWVHFLVRFHGHRAGLAPFLPRLPIACLVAVIGARRGRPAWLAWAVLLGSPVLSSDSVVVLAALPRLWGLRFAPASRPASSSPREYPGRAHLRAAAQPAADARR